MRVVEYALEAYRGSSPCRKCGKSIPAGEEAWVSRPDDAFSYHKSLRALPDAVLGVHGADGEARGGGPRQGFPPGLLRVLRVQQRAGGQILQRRRKGLPRGARRRGLAPPTARPPAGSPASASAGSPPAGGQRRKPPACPFRRGSPVRPRARVSSGSPRRAPGDRPRPASEMSSILPPTGAGLERRGRGGGGVAPQVPCEGPEADRSPPRAGNRSLRPFTH